MVVIPPSAKLVARCSWLSSVIIELKITIPQESIHTYTKYPSGFDPP
jgi:hypothetical protein